MLASKGLTDDSQPNYSLQAQMKVKPIPQLTLPQLTDIYHVNWWCNTNIPLNDYHTVHSAAIELSAAFKLKCSKV